jgi:hypothetical protein
MNRSIDRTLKPAPAREAKPGELLFEFVLALQRRAMTVSYRGRSTCPTNARKLDALETFAPDGQNVAERKITTRKRVVDDGRIELPTSALRTRRSPS